MMNQWALPFVAKIRIAKISENLFVLICILLLLLMQDMISRTRHMVRSIGLINDNKIKHR